MYINIKIPKVKTKQYFFCIRLVTMFKEGQNRPSSFGVLFVSYKNKIMNKNDKKD